MNANIYKHIFIAKSQIIGYEDESVCIESYNGNKLWYYKGQLHRINGPAVVCANGDKYWWYDRHSST